MRRCWVAAGFLYLLSLAFSPRSAGAAETPALETFQQRRDRLIAQVTANPKAAVKDHPFFVAEACFIAGKIGEG